MGCRVKLDARTALAILAEREGLSGRAAAGQLGGGVSNRVVLVEDGRRRFVLKQSLARLRVRDEWLADRSRIVREWQAMRALRGVLPAGRLPELLFLDRARFLYAMRAAPRGSSDWKTRLLAGNLSAATARLAGSTLGLMAKGTWERPEFRDRFADATAFDQLRTDPYYRTVAARHPAVAGAVAEWIERSGERRIALVHGDWSPKNLLVGREGLVCIDFECAHFGDPSYDAGFMLNHLILKAFHRPELASGYLCLARTAFAWTLGMLPRAALRWYERGTTRHLAFLMLARVDGKSPVEYLRTDAVRDAVRQLALCLIEQSPSSLREVLAHAERALRRMRRDVTRRP